MHPASRCRRFLRATSLVQQMGPLHRFAEFQFISDQFKHDRNPGVLRGHHPCRSRKTRTSWLLTISSACIKVWQFADPAKPGALVRHGT
jgi:hypothetical protein